MHNLFRVHETPIALGLLLVFITWGAKYIFERITSAPYIEYQFNYIEPDEYESWKKEFNTEIMQCSSRSAIELEKTVVLEVNMSNLSDKKLLRDVSIAFSYPPNGDVKVFGSQLLSKAPAIKPDNSEKCGVNYAEMLGVNFHPKSEFTFALAISKKREPFVVLSKSENGIILKESSLATQFVKNEFLIILLLILVGVFLSIFYLLEVSRSSETEGHDQ